MLGLQAVQKSNGFCVDTKPPSYNVLLFRLETVLKLLPRKSDF
jgi:hypothetical protein